MASMRVPDVRGAAETEAPVKPSEAPPDREADPDEDGLGEKVRRIIREIPGPTPQPGGE